MQQGMLNLHKISQMPGYLATLLPQLLGGLWPGTKLITFVSVIQDTHNDWSFDLGCKPRLYFFLFQPWIHLVAFGSICSPSSAAQKAAQALRFYIQHVSCHLPLVESFVSCSKTLLNDQASDAAQGSAFDIICWAQSTMNATLGRASTVLLHL